MEMELRICTDYERLEKVNEELKKECDRTKAEIDKVFQKHGSKIISRGELNKELPTDINSKIVDLLLVLEKMEK